MMIVPVLLKSPLELLGGALVQHLLHVDLVHVVHRSGVVHSEAHLRRADEGASFRVSESGDK